MMMQRLAAGVGVMALCVSGLQAQTSDAGLMQAREGHKTAVQIVDVNEGRKGAPPVPPAGEYTLVKYPAPAGALDAYLTPRPKGAGKHPAVIWAKGGYGGLGIFWEEEPAENDQTPRAFKDAGMVVMIPSWRGQGRNPGKFEMFYGEVQDAVAAIDYVAKLPYVDSSRIYFVGHSTGGTMALLTAEASTKLRAAFSLGGCPDVHHMVAGRDGNEEVPFDRTNELEGRLRSAINYVGALKTPTWYFEGDAEELRSFYCSDAMKMGRMAQSAGTPFHPFVLDGGTHFTIIRPVTQLIAQKIAADTGPTCNISITPGEIGKAWNGVFPGKPLSCILPAEPDVQITEATAKVFAMSLAPNRLSADDACIGLGVVKGRPVVGLESKSRVPKGLFMFVESNGVTVAMDYRTAYQLKGAVIDVEVDHANKRSRFVVRTKGQ